MRLQFRVYYKDRIGSLKTRIYMVDIKHITQIYYKEAQTSYLEMKVIRIWTTNTNAFGNNFRWVVTQLESIFKVSLKHHK